MLFRSLFATLVGSRSYAAIRAYGSVIAFRGRSEMVKAAASAYFHENPNRLSQKRLSDLLNLAGRYSARRNEIAHGLLTNTHTPHSQQQCKTRCGKANMSISTEK